MKNLQGIFATFIFTLMFLQGQTQSKLPGQQDWFLSTGNWQNDPQLYVREFGTGADTIVMLHGGWGGDHAGLLDAVANLGTQYHFVFYDQRGSLRSPFPDSLITFNQHIEDLDLLRRDLHLKKLNIVAHSMGAVLACAYATKYPQRVKRLTLLAPAPLKNPVPEEDKALQAKSAAAQQAYMERPAVNQELNKYNLNRATPVLSSQEETSKFRIQFAKRMLFDITKWNLLTGGRALYKGNVFGLTANTYPSSGWNYFEEFKHQNYPVNIIIGDHDFLDFGAHVNKKWSGEVPRLKMTTIPNAGHLLWIDQPQVFVTELHRVLK
jgi:proline iminopeptidase